MIPFGVTSADFVETFPEFADVDADVITTYLSRSAIFVDESWPDNVGPLALSNVTAHMLVEDGVQTSSAGVSAGTGSIAAQLAKIPGLTGFKIDDLDVRFASQSAATAADPDRGFEDRINETRYGRFFKLLRDKYFGGGIIV